MFVTDREVDLTSERISTLEGKVVDLEAGYMELLALGWEQVEMSSWAAQGLGQLATAVLAQQHKIRVMDKRIDTMREIILALEHTQANPIVVDEKEMAVSDGLGEELEVEENEVAIPVPVTCSQLQLRSDLGLINKLTGSTSRPPHAPSTPLRSTAIDALPLHIARPPYYPPHSRNPFACSH